MLIESSFRFSLEFNYVYIGIMNAAYFNVVIMEEEQK